MNNTSTDTPLPAAWLQPISEDYKIPFWRWILFPATTIMLKRSGGKWINGTLQLVDGKVRFTQTTLTKSKRNPPQSWTIALADIYDVVMTKGMASEKIDIRYSGGVIKLMTLQSAGFVDQVQQAIALQQA